MKRKLLKSLLAVAMLCVGVGNVWAQDPIETVGANDFTTGWWSAFSNPYSLEGYGKYHFQFTTTNIQDGSVWKTWLLVATDGNDSHGGGGTEYFVWRGEGYAWGQGTSSNDTPDKLVCSNTYSTANPTGAGIQAAMNGASVDMVITRESHNIYATATVTPTNGENEFTMSFSYLYGNATSANVGLFFTVENAQVVLNTAEQTASWSTAWTTDFSSAPSGMTYSCAGACDITNGYLSYHQNSGSGDRSSSASFTDDAFNVSTSWIVDFDWNASSSNTNPSNVAFATNEGVVFSASWAAWASTATITDASDKSLTTALPILGYNKSTMTSSSHFTIYGIPEDGIYLTVTSGNTTYINNVKISSTFGYPSTFNGTLGRGASHMYLDNIIFRTPAVAGYVSTPTYTITAPDGTNRKFTLDCLTDGATIYYATSDLEKGAGGWLTYSSEVSTDATTIYTYAKKGSDTSEKTSFATGAGTAITLNSPTIEKTAYSEGNYTVTISSNQSNLDIVPASTVIKYAIDGGEEQTYSSAIAVPAGCTVTAHVEATGYSNSSSQNCVTGVQPTLPVVWTQNYVGITVGDITMYQESENYYNCIVSNVGDNYCVYSSDNISASANANAGFQVYEGKNPRKWMVRPSGGMYNFTAGNAGVGIANLLVGQIVKIEWTSSSYGGLTHDSGVTKLDNICYGSVGFFEVTSTGTAYFTAARNSYIRNITVYSEVVPVTISSAGWATLYTSKALDFSGVAGLTAYTASLDESTVTLTPVDDVPANTGVVLQGDAGTYDIPVITSSSTAQGSLTGNAAAPTTYDAFDGYTLYVLKLVNEGKSVQFNPVTSGTIAAGKAFLKVTSSSSVKAFNVVFGDATAIDSLSPSLSRVSEGTIFNLAGQRVSKLQKGVNIVNGKKVIIK